MSRKITVNVTQDHIDRATEGKDRGNPYLCPVGRALGTLGFGTYAVFGTAVRFRNGPLGASPPSEYHDVELPENVREWVHQFDKNQPVEPITFNLELPDEVEIPEGITATVRVEVTQEDIAAGERYRSRKCPLALAISRASGYVAHVGGSPNGVSFYTSDPAYRNGKYIGGAVLPYEAEKFYVDFDEGREVFPFCFELEFIKAER